MIVVFAVVYASAQQTPPPAVKDIQSLAGKYTGWGVPASGSQFPIEVQVRPDGSYTVMSSGATSGQGQIKLVGGDKITTEGYLGGGDPTKGTSQANVTNKDGKIKISGQGHNDRGPFNYELTKQ
jgi:hypothetical protein